MSLDRTVARALQAIADVKVALEQLRASLLSEVEAIDAAVAAYRKVGRGFYSDEGVLALESAADLLVDVLLRVRALVVAPEEKAHPRQRRAPTAPCRVFEPDAGNARDGDAVVLREGTYEIPRAFVDWVSGALVVITPGAPGFVTSAQVETVGGHEVVRLWIRRALVGELTMSAGDGQLLCERLGLRERKPPLGAAATLNDLPPKRAPVRADESLQERPGSISWDEHLKAYADHARRYGTSPSAEQIAEKGGFSYWELTNHLGHEPTTWKERSGL